MFICRQNDAEEKPHQKRSMVDVYFHCQSVEMRLKTQRHYHQAAYISMLSYPVFRSYLALKLLYLYSSNSSRVAQAFKIDVVAFRYTAKGKC